MSPDPKNYTLVNIGPLESLSEKSYDGRTGKYYGKCFVGKDLGLTGCEVSLNRLPAGTGVPFVHAHKKNEELYMVIRGQGTFYLDGEEFPIQEGSLVRVVPAGARALKAGDVDLYYICIQAEEGSLHHATRGDGIILESKASWMKSGTVNS